MKSSTLKVVCWILLLFCNSVQAQTQTNLAKKETASSISGKVTIKGKGAPGIVVGVRKPDPYGRPTVTYKGTTDQDGNYKITNVAPGTYQVTPAAPAFVNPGEPRGKTLMITEGETVEGIDFALTRGGVITGRVTDSESRPLIEEQIYLVLAETNREVRLNQASLAYNGGPGGLQTDDRGIYRLFGIPQGMYRVAVGQGEGNGGERSSHFKQTFHPAATDASKAAVIEVSEGSETTDVDITVGSTLTTFTASGRIVDGETGQPLSNIRYALQMFGREQGSMSISDFTSDKQGEFKLENLTAGRYAVLMLPGANGEMRSEPVKFDLIDHDVTGLLLKASQGASVSGVILLEGTNDKSVLARLRQAQLQAYVEKENSGDNWAQSVTVKPDGGFRIGGLQGGIARFFLNNIDGSQPRGFTIMRVERAGIAQTRGLEIREGEQVTGVRLVVGYGNGTIRGVVRIENTELPSIARFTVWVTIHGDDPTRAQTVFRPSSPVDSRGHFLVEGLTAGNYEVHASIYIPGSRTRPSPVMQQVNVADGVVTEVIITVNLAPTTGPGNP